MRHTDQFVTDRQDNITFVDFGLARSRRDAKKPQFAQGDVMDKVPEHIRRAVAAEVAARFVIANIDWSDPERAAEQAREQVALSDALTSEPIELNPFEHVLVQHLAATEYSAMREMVADRPS